MFTREYEDLVERQRLLVAAMASSIPTVFSEGLFGLYADMMVGLEAGLSEWVNRRREAALDMQTLLVRTREAHDAATILAAQQDWIMRAFRRAAADATILHSALVFANHLTSAGDASGGVRSASVTPMPIRNGKPNAPRGPFGSART